MTNPTPHGQVPEALRLAEQYDYGDPATHGNAWKAAVCTELRRQHTRIAELEAQIEALSGVQALSAAPEAFLKGVIALCSHRGYSPANIEAWDKNEKWIADLWRQAEAMLATSPPAEQQATKETSGGFHVWRDISTAPKDGSRFVATGHNYGLYSEGRHACVAQWFRGSWIEASEWNEASELTYLTHWMPLPSPPDDVAAPAEQQATPKAAPGEMHNHQILAITIAYEQGVGKGRQAHESGKEIANPYGTGYRCDLAWQYGYEEGKKQAERIAEAAPQQEAQEPAVAPCISDAYERIDRFLRNNLGDEDYADFSHDLELLCTAQPTPQPAPDCHHRPPCDECAALAAQGGNK